jgi:hypothetical protein
MSATAANATRIGPNSKSRRAGNSEQKKPVASDNEKKSANKLTEQQRMRQKIIDQQREDFIEQLDSYIADYERSRGNGKDYKLLDNHKANLPAALNGSYISGSLHNDVDWSAIKTWKLGDSKVREWLRCEIATGYPVIDYPGWTVEMTAREIENNPGLPETVCHALAFVECIAKELHLRRPRNVDVQRGTILHSWKLEENERKIWHQTQGWVNAMRQVIRTLIYHAPTFGGDYDKPEAVELLEAASVMEEIQMKGRNVNDLEAKLLETKMELQTAQDVVSELLNTFNCLPKKARDEWFKITKARKAAEAKLLSEFMTTPSEESVNSEFSQQLAMRRQIQKIEADEKKLKQQQEAEDMAKDKKKKKAVEKPTEKTSEQGSAKKRRRDIANKWTSEEQKRESSSDSKGSDAGFELVNGEDATPTSESEDPHGTTVVQLGDSISTKLAEELFAPAIQASTDESFDAQVKQDMEQIQQKLDENPQKTWFVGPTAGHDTLHMQPRFNTDSADF